MFYGNIIPKSDNIDLNKLYETVIIESDNLCKIIDSIDILNESGLLSEDNNEENSNTKQSVFNKLKVLIGRFIEFFQGLFERLKKKFNKAADNQYVSNAGKQAEKIDFEHTTCKMYDMTDEFENLIKNRFNSGVKELKVEFGNFIDQLEKLGKGQANSENIKFNEDKIKEILGLFDKYGGINNCNGKNNDCYTVIECKYKEQAEELISKFYIMKWEIFDIVENTYSMINSLKFFTNSDNDSGDYLKNFDFEKTKQFSVYIEDLTKIYNIANKLVENCDKIMKVNANSLNKAEEEEFNNKEK